MDFRQCSDSVATTGESPLWDACRDCLWWIDIQAQRLLRSDRRGETTATALAWQPGFVALGESGRLVVGMENGIWTHDPEQGIWDQISDLESDRPTLRLNDGKPDTQGRLWFGSMDMTGTGQKIGRLYRRNEDGNIVIVRDAVTVPNAIVPTSDGKGLWFLDTPTHNLEFLHLDVDGSVKESRIVYTFPDGCHGDGASEDREGNLWIAVIGPGEIWTLARSGELVSRHKTPLTRPTMALLGGPDGSDLFVTSQRRFLSFDTLAVEKGAGCTFVANISAKAAPRNVVKGL